ncbi:hypothetical protein SDC9_122451 [bioreactor metagenome]|uniref:Uncharacterized protein n=1 Tax=bioreactor metagenome TaxID=1076179 RepID=A0A645CEX7_9ZZZZ
MVLWTCSDGYNLLPTDPHDQPRGLHRIRDGLSGGAAGQGALLGSGVSVTDPVQLRIYCRSASIGRTPSSGMIALRRQYYVYVTVVSHLLRSGLGSAKIHHEQKKGLIQFPEQIRDRLATVCAPGEERPIRRFNIMSRKPDLCEEIAQVPKPTV